MKPAAGSHTGLDLRPQAGLDPLMYEALHTIREIARVISADIETDRK